jgi:hypothetical protein
MLTEVVQTCGSEPCWAILPYGKRGLWHAGRQKTGTDLHDDGDAGSHHNLDIKKQKKGLFKKKAILRTEPQEMVIAVWKCLI